MSTDSVSSLKVNPSQSKIRAFEANPVIERAPFDVFVSRIVRKHVALQYGGIEEILLTEERLISQAVQEIKTHLKDTDPKFKVPWAIARVIFLRKIRNMAAERLQEMDIDDDVRENALESIYREDFAELFPESWYDA